MKASQIHDNTESSCILPTHIGVIMDGNGRWAKLRGQSRTQGHRQGLEVAKAIVKRAADRGIPYITLYTFSTENWKRTQDEVGFLMSLIKVHLRAELEFYIENGIRVLHVGDLTGLPKDIADEIQWIVKETAHFNRTSVVLAINYGGQNEIVRAIKKIPPALLPQITEEKLAQFLDIPDLPPLDLLIRTGGDFRISNFLLWQSAYAELYFSDKLWPDWTSADLDASITEFNTRDRRYGAVK